MQIALPPLNAIILEDDEKRIARMRQALKNREIDLTLEVFPDAWSCGLRLCDWEENIGPKVDLILLDHDLPKFRGPSGEMIDAGSGLDVVELVTDISTRKNIPPVIIHSSNLGHRVNDMEAKLKRCNIAAYRCPAHSTDVPDLTESELLWIDQSWVKFVIDITSKYFRKSAAL